MAPEHHRLSRYGTMNVEDIANLPVQKIIAPTAHLYLWVPNALLPDGLKVMESWGFQYKSNIVWHKLRKDGALTAVALDFTFEMLQNFYYLELEEECQNFISRPHPS